ncbi:MAG: hypothetical protein LBU80_06720, partial [Rikenellaceae bacterium]|nr:hypothetical protein [Rikenellaceae bacterium]
AGINITDINTGAANPALTKTNRVFRKLEVIGRMQAALGKLGKYTTRIQSIDTFPNNEPSKTL